MLKLFDFPLALLTLVMFLAISHFLLKPFSPSAVQNEIYAFKFVSQGEKVYQIQGSDLDCHSSLQSVTCFTMLAELPLSATLQFRGANYQVFERCLGQYGQHNLSCSGHWDYENSAPSVIIMPNEVISVAQLAQLRQQQAPFLYWAERDWLHWVIICAMGIALLTMAYFFYPHQPLNAPLLGGIVSIMIAFITWFALSVESVRFVGEVGWGLALMALLGGGLMGLSKWFLLFYQPHFIPVRMVYSLVGSGVLFILAVFMMQLNLLFLGFVD